MLKRNYSFFNKNADDEDLIYENDYLDTELNLFKNNTFQFVKTPTKISDTKTEISLTDL